MFVHFAYCNDVRTMIQYRQLKGKRTPDDKRLVILLLRYTRQRIRQGKASSANKFKRSNNNEHQRNGKENRKSERMGRTS